PLTILEAIVCFFSIWSIIGLAGFHTYLTATNQTTNEDIKGSFSTKHGQDVYNPFSQGSYMGNCCDVICGPVPPSLLDSRGFVMPEDQLPVQPVALPNGGGAVTSAPPPRLAAAGQPSPPPSAALSASSSSESNAVKVGSPVNEVQIMDRMQPPSYQTVTKLSPMNGTHPSNKP
ncbi:hypothetical protein CAPTEDRAFT_208415, partial [Capitella teleta]